MNALRAKRLKCCLSRHMRNWITFLPFTSSPQRAMASRSAARCDQPLSRNTLIRSFKRIRFVTQQDFYAGYALIARYAKHPEAALSVQECIIDPTGYRPFLHGMEDTPKDVGLPDGDMQETLKAYTQSLGLGESLTQKLTEGLNLSKIRYYPNSHRPMRNHVFNNAVATLLVSLCPNIITLRVFVDSESHTPLGEYLLRNNYGMLSKPVLQQVNEVQLHPANCLDEREYVHLDSINLIRYFHRLPAVNTLSLEGLDDHNSLISPIPPRLSTTIKEIRMSHVDLSTEAVCNIVRIPKALERFSLSTNGLQNQVGYISTLDPGFLARSLSEHKDSLEELDLDTSSGDPSDLAVLDSHEEDFLAEETAQWYFIADRKAGSECLPLLLEDLPVDREYPALAVGSLRDFEALTHLSIRIGLLLGFHDTLIDHPPGSPLEGNYSAPYHASYRLVDALPPSLQFLRLYGYKKGLCNVVDGHVTELLQRKAELFPHLREIEGVDELLLGAPGTYPVEPEDEQVWRRPEDNLTWVCEG